MKNSEINIYFLLFSHLIKNKADSLLFLSIRNEKPVTTGISAGSPAECEVSRKLTFIYHFLTCTYNSTHVTYKPIWFKPKRIIR